jgi:hypothetical protein
MENESREGKAEIIPPRLDSDEIIYLKDFMEKATQGPVVEQVQMTEWGSGGSTLMFAPYFTYGTFISIEHNLDWFTKVTAALHDLGDESFLQNVTYCFAPPPVDPRFYGYGVPFEENPCFAANYINPVIPEVDIWESDIFFVDGICRGAILATIAHCAKRDAAVFLHDHHGPENREVWYKWATDMYERVEKVGNTLARLYL